jgi:hypothetical protein
MKTAALVLVVLCMLLPGIACAGSATSRWDVTIGGFVKADFGYADQGASADTFLAARKSGSSENLYDEYGSYYNAAGETRLNFLIKGPDTWGAKSSAFIEGDFRGGSGSNYGVFGLRHAYMKFDWPETSLLIGQTWQPWGYLNSYVYLNTNDLLIFNRGQRQPQITLTQKFKNGFSGTVSVFSPYNTLSSTNGENVVNSYTRSGYPQIAGEVNWKSEKLGTIGPWVLQFGVGGFYGIEKVAFDRTKLDASQPTTTTSTWQAGGNVATAGHFGSDNVDAWGASFKGFIPIIPEKKPGALANSLGVGFAAFTGQDWNGVYFSSQLQVPTYNQGSFDYAAPNFYGGWGQVMYYLTDKVSLNAQYGQIHYNWSRKQRTFPATGANATQIAFANAPLDIRQYILNVIYDVNPAVRIGVEFSRYYTKYVGPGYSLRSGSTTAYDANGLKDNGAFNSVRFAAIYFF